MYGFFSAVYLVSGFAIGKEVYWANTEPIIPLSEAQLLEKANADLVVFLYNEDVDGLDQLLMELQSQLALARTRINKFELTEDNDSVVDYLASQENMALVLPQIAIFQDGQFRLQFYNFKENMENMSLQNIFPLPDL